MSDGKSKHCDHCDPERCNKYPMPSRGDIHGTMYAQWTGGHCPVCRFIAAERAKAERMRAIAESMPTVTEEWMLADARKVRRYPICDTCGQVVIRGEHE